MSNFDSSSLQIPSASFTKLCPSIGAEQGREVGVACWDEFQTRHSRSGCALALAS